MRPTAFALLIAALTATTAFADSNGTIGAILNSETQVLGGPFDHGDAAGDPSNSTASAIFTSTFNATEVLIEGDVTGVIPFNSQFFFGEADIVVADPGGGTTTWQNPAGIVPDTVTTVAFSGATQFAAPTAVNGTWNFEFIDTFDDGPGADSISDNVSVTLNEVEANTDTSGNFSLGSVGIDDTATSVGEFLVGDIFDTYTLTTTELGFLTIETDADPDGISGGDTVDTEIGLFDSSGLLVAYDDDDGNGLYSLIDDALFGPDDYTLVVTGFGSNIAADQVGLLTLAEVTGGTSTGDYGVVVSLVAVPEPTALSLLAIAGLVGFTRRRR